MRKQIATFAVAGLVGLTGSALIAPGLASAATGGSSTAVTDRVSGIKDALKGLVSDGTITQSQADEVATTLADKLPARGPGGRHGGPGGPGRISADDVAAAIGVTVDELRTQQEAGKTLTQIAATKGVTKAQLVDKLVAAAEKELAADVTAGRLTQAQADARKADLKTRISEKVDRVGPVGGPGRRHRHDDDGDGPAGAPSTAASPAVFTA